MAFEFMPSDEQRMLVDTVRQFMAEETIPHERETERLGEVPLELGRQIQRRAIDQGLHAAGRPRGPMTDGDLAMAKLSAPGMESRVTDQAIQDLGGMGLMDELPLEMLWRDARIERIWDGTSEIQRHIIGCELLRPPEGKRDRG